MCATPPLSRAIRGRCKLEMSHLIQIHNGIDLLATSVQNLLAMCLNGFSVELRGVGLRLRLISSALFTSFTFAFLVNRYNLCFLPNQCVV